jgi:predicted RNase H-like HicB family nuclease
MEVHKEPDGRYKAHFPAHPQVPPALGRSENEAINLAKQALQSAHESGKVGS